MITKNISALIFCLVFSLQTTSCMQHTKKYVKMIFAHQLYKNNLAFFRKIRGPLSEPEIQQPLNSMITNDLDVRTMVKNILANSKKTKAPTTAQEKSYEGNFVGC